MAAENFSRGNPVPRTAGVLDHWNKAPASSRIATSTATREPDLIMPGCVFIMAFGGIAGHTGIVESVRGVYLTTIEGNTNVAGSREGIGVFRRTGRKIADVNRGFIMY